ncbi:TetR/AcrR family transcriptional regulator [Pectobacteriaceae bacterium CE70]|uniref:TetR/AcrR family transcriptional regulator n=1 Tax=Serratia sp. (strain ATCC 39006) TaxID=104623 RepID=A0A2I5T237_SERS3|nr:MULTISPECIES: TetR/AcrR family transcriptional regulator [Enterobacterales]WJV58409.1 TetR/AcrR family transcriptional regulator [Pectobacteriaceae bacterium C111]WJV67031.1 TetR/AcrR family transcriptional regulator [Pectobacteriaceae bacterium CE70]AUG98628.1 TetR/AcrR family transcriptional regulator [Serratia sp. ATCC 39006]AUH02943.1 TetR/AcrR family transcriptional regulator [Serratia sp. ATCC 39006]WJV54048.1 TetR/AcrR family transcriptional regulator [Prodigiosinella sp. LS101]
MWKSKVPEERDVIPVSSRLLPESVEEVEKGRIRQDNEAIIRLAAERIFARFGFKGATMALIAEAAGLPKANLHYYFGNKQTLYLTVLDTILHDWLSPLDDLHPQADPKTAIERYVRQKIRFSFERPEASKLFANEILQGAPMVHHLLQTELRRLVVEKSAVLDRWIADGRLQPLDAPHFFFSVWSMTQTYADFDIQIAAVLGDAARSADAQERATRHVLTSVFRICGLA